ncbi:hypothetical protein MS6201_03481 [Escherichia coli]|nr:hypothetical protein [Escherichia coli]
MAMPRLADLVNKMNFQGRLATSAIQIASFPEFLPVPSQESHLVLLTSEALRFPDSLLDLARQKLHAPAQAHNVLSLANHCAKPLPPPVHLYLDH